MARVISRHPLDYGAEPQEVSMQRRARILYVAPGAKGPDIFTECEQDATTKAVDVKHTRRFAVLMAGATAPEGSCYIGSCWVDVGRKTPVYLVYELSAVKPQGL